MTDVAEYGPAMAALTEKQRNFVLAMQANPFAPHNEWARAAGYSDSSEGCKVKACLLLQNERIHAACREVAGGAMQALGPILAVEVMLREAKSHDGTRRLKAAEMIANRVGLHETQEIKVTHRDLTGDALLARLSAVAERLGLDVQKLIGANTIIDAEATEIPDGSAGEG